MQISPRKDRGFFATALLTEIARGMALTLRRLFSPAITRQYPQEKPQVRRGFRGRHALVRDPATGATKCIGCMRCAMVCPSRCIRIRSHKKAAHGNRRFIDDYRIDALRCVYCGFCAEVCPVNAVILTEVFEYSAYDRQSLGFDMQQLLRHWDEYAASPGLEPNPLLNPLWRPRGLAEGDLPAGKRLPVSAEWKGETQVTGKYWREHFPEAPSGQ